METKFGATIRSSLDPQAPIGLLDAFLSKIGVIEPGAYRTRFAVTLGVSIWLPCRIGEVDNWSLESQIHIIGHECTHVEQFNRDGGTEFSWEYVTNPESRAVYEAEAYSAGDEIAFQLFGTEPDPQFVYDTLSNYHCDDPSREIARRICETRKRVTMQGSYSSKACKCAREFFRTS
jgi:hypothetical protein